MKLGGCVIVSGGRGWIFVGNSDPRKLQRLPPPALFVCETRPRRQFACKATAKRRHDTSLIDGKAKKQKFPLNIRFPLACVRSLLSPTTKWNDSGVTAFGATSAPEKLNESPRRRIREQRKFGPNFLDRPWAPSSPRNLWGANQNDTQFARQRLPALHDAENPPAA